MADTAYANPHGLDAAGHYTTARDLLVLSRRVMESSILAGLATQQEATLVTGDGPATEWASTNEFLGDYDGAIGLKTGWTSQAGDVLVAVAERNGRRLYAVVMGSRNAAADAALLLEHGFAVFGPAERRLVSFMEDPQEAALLRQYLPADALARIVHLRGINKRETAPWE